MNLMQQPNLLGSFFRPDPSFHVPLLTRTTDGARELLAAWRCGSAKGDLVAVPFSSHFVVSGGGSDRDYGQWDKKSGRSDPDVYVVENEGSITCSIVRIQSGHRCGAEYAFSVFPSFNSTRLAAAPPVPPPIINASDH